MDGSQWKLLTKCAPLGKGMANQYSRFENPMNNMQDKNMTLKDELPMLLGAQYATGELGRNNSRKNEETSAKVKTTPSCGCDW